MSFTWFAAAPLRTREQVAQAVHAVAVKRGLTDTATIIALMTISIEVGADDTNGNPQWWCPSNPTNDPESDQFPHDSNSDDGGSSGYLQQQPGPDPAHSWWGTAAQRMNIETAADMFLARLSNDYNSATDAHSAGVFAQQVQGSAFPDRYQTAWDTAHRVLANALAAPVPVPPTPPAPAIPAAASAPRPDFNEYALWSPNYQSRNGTQVDLWLWHTEEGHFGDPNAADDLTRGELDNPASQVSYHYSGSQAPDGGVTVIDVVDTDMASWSVLSANNRSIDFVIAGSTVNYTREQWLANSKVIDVGCYLSVLDCLKRQTLLPAPGVAPKVIAPDANNTNLYHSDPPGIADHKYVTQYLHDGTHSDMGPNFPWDYVEQRTAYWWAALTAAPTPNGGTPVPQPSTDPFLTWIATQTDRQLLEWVVKQLGPGDPAWPSKGMTLRDKVWSFVKGTP